MTIQTQNAYTKHRGGLIAKVKIKTFKHSSILT